MPIDDEIKKGERALKQLNEIKEEMNKNPLDITGNIKDKMKDIEDQLRKLKTVSGENIDEVKKLTVEFQELAKTKESIESLEKVIRGVGSALGIALPQLKALEIVMFITQTTLEWSENSAKVNKQLYDIGANLGHMGEMTGIATKNVSSLAWQFGVTTEEVRNTEIGLTKIGVEMKDLEDVTKNQVALSKLWTEYTPQEQTRIMGRYMKEFGMNGKEAQNVMIGIVDLANSLKDVMPNLDIKEFASQVQDVAISMRKYGLETSDSIALTATLTKLGIDQARIPELAKAIGGFAMSSPALGTVAMDAYVATLKKEEDEYKKLSNLQKEGGKELDEIQKKRLQQLQEERVHRQGLIEDVRHMDVLEKASYINTLKGGDAIKANFAGMTAILKSVTGETYATIDAAKAMTLSKLNPDLFPMGIAGTQALFKAREEFKEPLSPLKEGATGAEKEAYGEQIKLRKLVSEAGGVGSERGMQVLMEQVQKDLAKTGTKEDQRTKAAEQVADATTTSKNDISIIKGILGDWFRRGSGETEQAGILKRMAERGTKIKTVEEGIDMGLTEESAKKQLGIQTRAEKEASLPASEREKLRQLDLIAEARLGGMGSISVSSEEEKNQKLYVERLLEKQEKEAKERAISPPQSNIPYSTFFPSPATTQQDFLTGMTAELNVKDDGTMRLLLKKTGLLRD